jgi:hypothetical protein
MTNLRTAAEFRASTAPHGTTAVSVSVRRRAS